MTAKETLDAYIALSIQGKEIERQKTLLKPDVVKLMEDSHLKNVDTVEGKLTLAYSPYVRYTESGKDEIKKTKEWLVKEGHGIETVLTKLSWKGAKEDTKEDVCPENESTS